MAGLKGKTVLVTGGTGFIGSNLVERLVNIGSKVIVGDIAVDPNSLFIRNQIHRKASFEILDVRNLRNVEDIINKYNPEYIYHLAAQTIVPVAFKNPLETLETNVMGTINLLEIVRKNTFVKAVIVASSDKAYGKSIKAYDESFPLKGDHPYDVSKSSADLITQSYFATYKTPVVITRFGNVYGEGDLHFNRIIPGICKAIMEDEPLEIRSNGKYIRDYLYVKDVVEGYIFLAENIRRTVSQAYNFSSNVSCSVIELIGRVEKVLGKRVKYKILNNAVNEIPVQHLNDAKIRKLGWKNKYTFEEAIKNTYEWYRNY